MYKGFILNYFNDKPNVIKIILKIVDSTAVM